MGFEESYVPQTRPICVANIGLDAIKDRWDALVHLAASVFTGHSSAIHVMGRFGSASRGDPFYEAGVQLGRLLRSVFLCDYFTNDAFRRELHRVLNRGEAANALKRAIYSGRVANYQAKREEEMQAVAEALNLLATIVMTVERDADANGVRMVVRPPADTGPARTHRPDRAHPNRGH